MKLEDRVIGIVEEDRELTGDRFDLDAFVRPEEGEIQQFQSGVQERPHAGQGEQQPRPIHGAGDQPGGSLETALG